MIEKDLKACFQMGNFIVILFVLSPNFHTSFMIDFSIKECFTTAAKSSKLVFCCIRDCHSFALWMNDESKIIEIGKIKLGERIEVYGGSNGRPFNDDANFYQLFVYVVGGSFLFGVANLCAKAFAPSNLR